MGASDREAVEDLFAYSGWAWGEIAKVVEAADDPDEFVNRVAPGSGWPNIGACLVHMNLAYERWLNEPTIGLRVPGPDELGTWAAIRALRDNVRAAFEARLGSFTDDALTAVRDFDIDGEMFPYSPGELLTHLLLHERGHHGDFMTLLYQLGVEQVGLEYRFHLLAQRGYA